jgi:hypothetical protein
MIVVQMREEVKTLMKRISTRREEQAATVTGASVATSVTADAARTAASLQVNNANDSSVMMIEDD